MDYHTVLHQGVAGSGQLVDSLHLYSTDPAGADFVDVSEVTEGRDVDLHLFGCVQDGGAFRNSDSLVVDGQGYHFANLPPLNPAWP